MFLYWLLGLGALSWLVLRWYFKRTPLFADVVILTLILLAASSLIQDIIRRQDMFQSWMFIIASVFLGISRYQHYKSNIKE
ncbi:hypothetical protein SAMN05518848_12328 [Paenibacillus sp. PDC88]|nr:hypothetical protein SAMN05518848_12328 [Paenibacillus sp. PDC88]